MAQSDLHSVLVETARILARGGQLETRLDALAHQVARATGASTAIVYLLDADAGSLIAAGGSGLAEDVLAAATVSIDDAADPVARAALERETLIAAADDPVASPAVSRLGSTVRALVCAPLIADEVAGAAEVHGVLAAGFDREIGDMAELSDLLGAMADLAAVIIRDARLEQALLERSDWLDRIATIDPLTGLANRRTFDRMLELELARGGRQASPLFVILFDVEGLPGIGAREGQESGDDRLRRDDLLRRVAATLAEEVRIVDTVARIGGDEFAVIAPGSGGETVARRIREVVGMIQTPSAPPISVRVGVSRYPDQGETAEALLASAIEALARARLGPGMILAWDEAATN